MTQSIGSNVETLAYLANVHESALRDFLAAHRPADGAQLSHERIVALSKSCIAAANKAKREAPRRSVWLHDRVAAYLDSGMAKGQTAAIRMVAGEESLEPGTVSNAFYSIRKQLRNVV